MVAQVISSPAASLSLDVQAALLKLYGLHEREMERKPFARMWRLDAIERAMDELLRTPSKTHPTHDAEAMANNALGNGGKVVRGRFGLLNSAPRLVPHPEQDAETNTRALQEQNRAREAAKNVMRLTERFTPPSPDASGRFELEIRDVVARAGLAAHDMAVINMLFMGQEPLHIAAAFESSLPQAQVWVSRARARARVAWNATA